MSSLTKSSFFPPPIPSSSRSIHIFAMCAVSYAFLRLLSPLWAFRFVFSYSLLYLSWANIYRMSFDYGSISADVSL
ncbi:hypothetical protein AAHC03_024503 [Spirometra sp. Aus1]